MGIIVVLQTGALILNIPWGKGTIRRDFPEAPLYAYLNLNQIKRPEVSKFRSSPAEDGL
jgi:hypothetical protein